jgi:biotin carboxylase
MTAELVAISPSGLCSRRIDDREFQPRRPPPVYLGPARDAESLLAFDEVRAVARRELAKATVAAAGLIAANREALDDIAARLLADGRIEGKTVAAILARRTAARAPRPRPRTETGKNLS